MLCSRIGNNSTIGKAMQIRLDAGLPDYPAFEQGKRRAPDRGFRLTPAQAEVVRAVLEKA